MPTDIGTIHFVGIGGIGMSGIAEVMHNLGYTVQGSDIAESANTRRLNELGIKVAIGHRADNVSNAQVVVVSSAVKKDNPEVMAARARLVPVVRRAEMLGELMRLKWSIAVGGTHGKTTTTSMLAWILESAGQQPGFLIGGVPLNFGVSARLGAPRRPSPGSAPLGDAPLFVIEADEYDTAFFDKRSKFVHYRPRTAVLNNLEFDHADIFDNLAAIERQFHHLVRTVPPSGRVVVNGLEESLTRVLHTGCWSEVSSFGEAVSDFSAEGDPQAFDVLHQGRKAARVEWALTGVHNQLNALAAIAAAHDVGVAPAVAAAALGQFENVKRRMELRGTVRGIAVYDDFAHHPTAIRTTLDGLQRRLGSPRGRILAVFEPRSNTMKLGTMKSQLPWSLEAADLAFCHSGGLDWDAVEALAPMGSRARVAGNIDTLVQQVVAAAQAGDHIVCMSNGGFGGIHDKLLAALKH